jgi:hypothetical protein
MSSSPVSNYRVAQHEKDCVTVANLPVPIMIDGFTKMKGISSKTSFPTMQTFLDAAMKKNKDVIHNLIADIYTQANKEDTFSDEEENVLLYGLDIDALEPDWVYKFLLWVSQPYVRLTPNDLRGSRCFVMTDDTPLVYTVYLDTVNGMREYVDLRMSFETALMFNYSRSESGTDGLLKFSSEEETQLALVSVLTKMGKSMSRVAEENIPLTDTEERQLEDAAALVRQSMAMLDEVDPDEFMMAKLETDYTKKFTKVASAMVGRIAPKQQRKRRSRSPSPQRKRRSRSPSPRRASPSRRS